MSTSGSTDNDYAFYLDVIYTDNTALYGQILQFDPNNANWHFREGFIAPAKPIKTIYAYALFRYNHAGTAWFDDLTIKELQTGTEILDFDTVRVATTPSTLYGGSPLALSTTDGLGLTLASDGGAVTGLSLEGVSVHDASHAYAGGSSFETSRQPRTSFTWGVRRTKRGIPSLTAVQSQPSTLVSTPPTQLLPTVSRLTPRSPTSAAPPSAPLHFTSPCQWPQTVGHGATIFAGTAR